MIELIHVSDLHYHGSKDKNETIDSALDAVRDSFPSSYLLATGDVTDDGKQDQYAHALAKFKTFPTGKVLLCPGNHDYGTTGLFYQEDRARQFDLKLTMELGTDDTYFRKSCPVSTTLRGPNGETAIAIGINGVCKTLDIGDFACGEVGDEQLQVLDLMLKNPAAKDIPKIVFVHFHPFVRGIFDFPTMRLKDSDRLLAILKGRVKVLAFGHKHEPGLWKNKHGIPYIVAAGSTPDWQAAWRIRFIGENVSVSLVKLSGGSWVESDGAEYLA